MSDWKRPLFIGVGWGFGTAAGLAIVLGVFLWYEARPKAPEPPKEWDTASIKAQYDTVDTEGDKNYLVFYYTLQNTTDFDYKMPSGEGIAMNARLERQNSLSPFDNAERIDYPIFVPAKKRVRFPIHINYAYPVKPKENGNAEERKKYREALEKYVADELTNLDGFDLLDEANRYEIVFPSGWKHSKQ